MQFKVTHLEMGLLPPEACWARARDGARVIALGEGPGAPWLNDGLTWRPGDPRQDDWQAGTGTVGAAEKRWRAEYRKCGGVIESLPLWVRQIGVYRAWINIMTLTSAGHAMLRAADSEILAATGSEREMLHADAQARKAAAAERGAERVNAHNERVSLGAQARKAAVAEARAQRKAAVAAVDLAVTTSWPQHTAGAVPLLVWLDAESTLVFARLNPGAPVSATAKALLTELAANVTVSAAAAVKSAPK